MRIRTQIPPYTASKMATIIREIWGAHPSFLKFPTKRNLLELVAHTPNSGVGLRVVPTVWYKKNWHDSFWTVTEVKMKKVRICEIIGFIASLLKSSATRVWDKERYTVD